MNGKIKPGYNGISMGYNEFNGGDRIGIELHQKLGYG
jgi:hypothetical protein